MYDCIQFLPPLLPACGGRFMICKEVLLYKVYPTQKSHVVMRQYMSHKKLTRNGKKPASIQLIYMVLPFLLSAYSLTLFCSRLTSVFPFLFLALSFIIPSICICCTPPGKLCIHLSLLECWWLIFRYTSNPLEDGQVFTFDRYSGDADASLLTWLLIFRNVYCWKAVCP